jgi:hypothetical protein
LLLLLLCCHQVWDESGANLLYMWNLPQSQPASSQHAVSVLHCCCCCCAATRCGMSRAPTCCTCGSYHGPKPHCGSSAESACPILLLLLRCCHQVWHESGTNLLYVWKLPRSQAPLWQQR